MLLLKKLGDNLYSNDLFAVTLNTTLNLKFKIAAKGIIIKKIG